MDVKSGNGEKIRNFLELFGPPCRIALADLDGSTPECAQVCAYILNHIWKRWEKQKW